MIKEMSLREAVTYYYDRDIDIDRLGVFIPFNIEEVIKKLGIEKCEVIGGISINYRVEVSDNLKSKGRWSTSGTYGEYSSRDAKILKDYLNQHWGNIDKYNHLGLGYFIQNGTQLDCRKKVMVELMGGRKSLAKRTDFYSDIEWIRANIKYWQNREKIVNGYSK
jgi:hypothetical protein